MAAVLSSRLVKHYSAPCRPLPPPPFLLSLRFVRILVLPPLVLFVHLVRTACLAYPVSYARILIRVPIPRRPLPPVLLFSVSFWPMYSRKQGKRTRERKSGEERTREANASTTTAVSPIFLRFLLGRRRQETRCFARFSSVRQRKPATMDLSTTSERKSFLLQYLRGPKSRHRECSDDSVCTDA